MTLHPPLLSIVIPAFNAESTILRAFNSIYYQIFSSLESDIEIIFVDDASTDSTPQKIKGLIKFHQRVVLISHTSNKGVSSARSSGAKHATGIYIKFMDADDYIPSDSLHKLIKILKNSEYLLYIGKSFVETSGTIQSADGIYNLPKYSIVNEFVNEIYLLCQATQMGLWIINREFLINNITFDINNSLGEEFDFCLQIIKQHQRIKYLDINFLCIVNSDNPNRLSRSVDPIRHWIQFDRINTCLKFIQKNYGTESKEALDLFARNVWIRGRDSVRLGLLPLASLYFDMAREIRPDFKPYGGRIYKFLSLIFGPIFSEYLLSLIKKINFNSKYF
jgi:glycosyltransferase involved in cell wall biosynthesis